MDSNLPGPTEAELPPDPAELPPVRVRALFGTTFRIYRAHFPRIAGTAIAVFVPLGFLETFVIDVAEGYQDHHSTLVASLILAGVFVASNFGLFGDAIYAGFLDAAVGEGGYGQARTPLPTILRNLPYRRLIVAEFVTTLVTAFLSLAFIVPGIIANTVWCIVGPLINIERLTVRQALVRSYRLVRPVFWIALVSVTIPVLLEEEIAHAIEGLIIENSYLDGVLVNGFLSAFVWSIVGMLEVTLAYELIRRDRAQAAPPPEDAG